MRVLISGSTGLIGKQLCAFFACMGHEVHRLVKSSTKLPADANKENIVKWDDQEGDPGRSLSKDSTVLST